MRRFVLSGWFCLLAATMMSCQSPPAPPIVAHEETRPKGNFALTVLYVGNMQGMMIDIGIWPKETLDTFLGAAGDFFEEVQSQDEQVRYFTLEPGKQYVLTAELSLGGSGDAYRHDVPFTFDERHRVADVVLQFHLADTWAETSPPSWSVNLWDGNDVYFEPPDED